MVDSKNNEVENDEVEPLVNDNLVVIDEDGNIFIAIADEDGKIVLSQCLAVMTADEWDFQNVETEEELESLVAELVSTDDDDSEDEENDDDFEDEGEEEQEEDGLEDED